MSKLNQTIKHEKWFATCVYRSLNKNRFACPNCGSSESTVIDSKFSVTNLRDCHNCALQFRTPTDPPEESKEYYQQQYSLGFTTELPSPEVLNFLMKSKFENHEKSYSYITDLLKIFYPQGGNIFDFGCSWGYGSWQIREAGFSVLSYEISQPRALYAKQKLGVEIIDLLNPPTDLDVFFSNHVIEHVPSPSETIALARKVLKPDGLFIAITPNGSEAFKNIDFSAWHMLWAQDHPNLLNETFYQKEFKDNPYIISSSPKDSEGFFHWDNAKTQQTVLSLDTSSELIVVARPNVLVS